MYDIKEIRKQFPMLNNDIKMQGKPLVYLDNSSTTFKPQCVIDEMNKYYTSETSNSHRGDYDLAYNTDRKILEARKTVAKFVNSEVNEVVFTGGDTLSLNMIAYSYGLKNLKEDDEIVVSIGEHASNLLPWFNVSKLTKAKIVYAPLDEDGKLDEQRLKEVLNNRTKVVSLAHVGNVMGYRLNIKEIAKICHEIGAILVVDGAQSVPHFKTDFKGWDIDFLCFSGHKMCGPTGVGCLIGKKHLLDELDPLIVGGGMNENFTRPNNMIPFEAPEKFEAGTLNIAGILGLKVAIDFLSSIGMDNIEAHERVLKEYAVSRLKDSDVILYNAKSPSGILTFNMPNIFAQDEATYLNYKGIAIRSGQHCDKLLNEYLGVPATCRASFYLYTTKEEVDVLIDNLLNGGDFLDAYFN